MIDLKKQFLYLISKYSDDGTYNLKCWNLIEKAYSSKGRHYHNLSHLENMLIELDYVKPEVNDLDDVLFSIFYHDIVYKSTSSNNESQSALVFEGHISKTSFSNINRVKKQIEDTKIHLLSQDNDTNYLIDIDLSILGQSADVYAKYCVAIRNEYKIYPDFMYRKGRRKALIQMLSEETIFKTDFFINKYEKQAQHNIQVELDSKN